MKELAEFLKSERLKRDLTLQDVSLRSGIGVDMLRRLEAEGFDCFGAPMLIRNAVRGYCGALRMDPAPLLEKYAARIEACDVQQRGIERYGQQMKLLRRRRRMLSFPLFLLALATLGILYGGMWISEKRARLYAPPPADRIATQEDLPAELLQKLAQAEKKGMRPDREALRTRMAVTASREADRAILQAEENLRQAETVQGADRPEEVAKAEVVEENSHIARNPPAPEPAPPVSLSHSSEVMAEDMPVSEEQKVHRFVVEADAKTWVQVKIDEKSTRSAMLYPGDKREWTAHKGMQVVVGNAGGVHMKWNDQPVKAPRDPGHVLRFRLPDYAQETE